MGRFHGRSYLYADKQIGVTRGLGDQYIIAYYAPSGAKHRVRNYTKLGVYDNPADAQRALDKFAAEQGLTGID